MVLLALIMHVPTASSSQTTAEVLTWEGGVLLRSLDVASLPNPEGAFKNGGDCTDNTLAMLGPKTAAVALKEKVRAPLRSWAMAGSPSPEGHFKKWC